MEPWKSVSIEGGSMRWGRTIVVMRRLTLGAAAVIDARVQRFLARIGRHHRAVHRADARTLRQRRFPRR